MLFLLIQGAGPIVQECPEVERVVWMLRELVIDRPDTEAFRVHWRREAGSIPWRPE